MSTLHPPGLLYQSQATPYTMYGQQQVVTPWLNALTSRFGGSPAGLATPVDLRQQTYYQPPVVHPSAMPQQILGAPAAPAAPGAPGVPGAIDKSGLSGIVDNIGQG